MRKRVSCWPAVTRSGDLDLAPLCRIERLLARPGATWTLTTHLARGLRVAVSRRHRGGLLQAQHVLEPGIGQRVEERQLGRAGIAGEL